MSDLIVQNGLEPWTRNLCREHQVRAASEGLETMLPKTGGFRTPDEQLEQYAKGRKLVDGLWVVVDEGETVTRALPEKAPHCRRAAYDLWLMYEKRMATMDPKDGWTPAQIEEQIKQWATIVRIGTELGLVAGAHFSKLKDWPHFERPDWRSLPYPV